ncbi:translation initiation factor IF-2-like [Pipra filicauda]|uniref:Translation initiation factor IF-2-like n=1 Tax=Pipra filicauda TaxID=649802 RepID=A0A6J2J417_9PASS|nr:translation initiation factor IF-2-like [Pipra filicauda]
MRRHSQPPPTLQGRVAPRSSAIASLPTPQVQTTLEHLITIKPAGVCADLFNRLLIALGEQQAPSHSRQKTRTKRGTRSFQALPAQPVLGQCRLSRTARDAAAMLRSRPAGARGHGGYQPRNPLPTGGKPSSFQKTNRREEKLTEPAAPLPPQRPRSGHWETCGSQVTAHPRSRRSDHRGPGVSAAKLWVPRSGPPQPTRVLPLRARHGGPAGPAHLAHLSHLSHLSRRSAPAPPLPLRPHGSAGPRRRRPPFMGPAAAPPRAAGPPRARDARPEPAPPSLCRAGEPRVPPWSPFAQACAPAPGTLPSPTGSAGDAPAAAGRRGSRGSSAGAHPRGGEGTETTEAKCSSVPQHHEAPSWPVAWWEIGRFRPKGHLLSSPTTAPTSSSSEDEEMAQPRTSVPRMALGF